MLYKYLVILVVTLFLSACSTINSSDFNEIDDEKTRIISMGTTEAELSPGDTATVEVYFAGKDVSPAYLCSLSLDVHTTVYGEEVDGKTASIDSYRVINPKNPDIVEKAYIRFSFIVPDSIFYYSKSIPEYPFTIVDDYAQDAFTDSLKNMRKSEFISFASQFLASSNFTTVDNELKQHANLITQILSVKMRLKMVVNGDEKIQTSINVRLNKRVKSNEMVAYNRIPVINWIKLYEVKKENDKAYFDPKEDRSYTYFYLMADSATLQSENQRIDSVVTVKEGYLYYVEADTGISAAQPNSTKDFTTTMIGVQNEEIWSNSWFVKQNGGDLTEIKSENQANLGNNDIGVVQLNPPDERSITSVDIWCVTRDFAIGERFRPIAKSVKKMRVYFKW